MILSRSRLRFVNVSVIWDVANLALWFSIKEFEKLGKVGLWGEWHDSDAASCVSFDDPVAIFSALWSFIVSSFDTLVSEGYINHGKYVTQIIGITYRCALSCAGVGSANVIVLCCLSLDTVGVLRAFSLTSNPGDWLLLLRKYPGVLWNML